MLTNDQLDEFDRKAEEFIRGFITADVVSCAAAIDTTFAHITRKLTAELRELRRPMSDPDLAAIEADVTQHHEDLVAGAPLSRENAIAMLKPEGWVRRLLREVRGYRQRGYQPFA